MAYRFARADGNWTDAATWGEVDATSLVDNQVAGQLVTTAFVSSSAFTPGAITVAALAVKLHSRTLAASGTFSIQLAQAGVLVPGTDVTVNVSDLPTTTLASANTYNSCPLGWIIFAFAAPVTLAAATAYTLQVKTTVTSMVTLYRDATGNNWSRCLITTATGAPAAGDALFICGDRTAAGVPVTSRLVTYDGTGATDYGTASTILASLGVGDGGRLAVATTPATAFQLRLSGIMQMWVRTTADLPFTAGTVANPIPSSSSFRLEFDCAVDGDFGLVTFGPNVEFCGAPRTAGKPVVVTRLNTDEAIGQTVLGVDADTGWLSGDQIVIAPTRRVATQAEARTLGANATATELTISAGLTFAHDGDLPNKTQADVILRTRNVQVVAVTAGVVGFLDLRNGGTWRAAWTEFWNLGGLSSKWAFDFGPGGGTLIADFCSFGGSEGTFFRSALPPAALTLTLTDCVFWDTGQHCIDVSNNVPFAITLTRCVLINDGGALSAGVLLSGTTNFAATLIAVGCRFSGMGTITVRADTAVVRISGCEFYANAGSNGIVFLNSLCVSAFIESSLFWRNVTSGLEMSSRGRIVVEGCEFWGNQFQNITTNVAPLQDGAFELIGCVLNGDTGFVTTTGITLNSSRMRIDGCTFGVAAGERLTHGTQDINGQSATQLLTLVNTILASATKIAGVAILGSRVAYQRKDGVTGTAESTSSFFGTIARDGTVTRSSPASQRLTPVSQSAELRSAPKQFAIRVGARLTFTVYVRTDAAYNGQPPRLRLAPNSAIGIVRYTTLDTHTGVPDVWEALTGQTPVALEDGVATLFVECEGTAGNVYVDDWSAQIT